MKRTFTKHPINANSIVDSSEYIFYFGDGSYAASRGAEPENDLQCSGNLSSDAMAFVAAYYIQDLCTTYGDGFTDQDVWDVIDSYGHELYEEDLEQNTAEDWINALESKDISDGSPLLYRITQGNRDVYYNRELEELVKSNQSDYDA